MLTTEIAVVGAGPAGLSAACAAREAGAQVTLLDDQSSPGGQLFKQIHKFFGSQEHLAGTRGFEIGRQLLDRAREVDADIVLNGLVMGVFEGPTLGLVRDGRTEQLQAKKIIMATGAEENRLAFPGWTLPGVMTAGAAQTLMNIHRVLPGQRVLMVGSGNVGLIVSYQLLQAGAEVVAVVEALPNIGGYWVHASKLRRAGVPILTHHTIVEARGKERVEEALIVQVDKNWKPIEGTERTLAVDAICLAVGLSPSTRLTAMAGCQHEWKPALGGLVPIHDENLQTTVPGIYVAGDVAGVEEATTAMEQGRIAGLAAAHSLGYLPDAEFESLREDSLRRLASLHDAPAPLRLESNIAETGILEPLDLVGLPGVPSDERMAKGPVAVMECAQMIPCNPCETSCFRDAVSLGGSLTSLPELDTENCSGCGLCLAACPGQAVFVVDMSFAPGEASVAFPYEFLPLPAKGTQVQGTDRAGNPVCPARVVKVDARARYDKTAIVTVAVPREYAHAVRGIAWRELRGERS
jgi:thioredoxin reductase/Fe-S-cluster-containing hydrogenase component 2